MQFVQALGQAENLSLDREFTLYASERSAVQQDAGAHTGKVVATSPFISMLARQIMDTIGRRASMPCSYWNSI